MAEATACPTSAITSSSRVTIDGLRGVAAITVLLFHAKDWFGATRPTNGYIAVDLFFALSRFVIAASYERRLKAGLTFWRFFLIRTIRLYPLYLVGLALAVGTLLASGYSHGRFIGGHSADWRALPFALLALMDAIARKAVSTDVVAYELEDSARR